MLRLLALLGVLVALASAIHPSKVSNEARELTGQALVDHINSQKGTWTATSYPRFEGKSPAELKKFLGANKKPTHMRRRGVRAEAKGNVNAPKEFDSVDNWPQCADLVGLIQDQSACGSCWAVSTASALSDRLCIASDAKIKKSLSSVDLMACCYYCGFQCQGGWPDEAFYFFADNGIVTGANYTSDDGCKPYPIPPCTQDPVTKRLSCPDEPEEDYKCEKKCSPSYNEQTYADDKYYGKGNVLYFWGDNKAVIEELTTNGPVVAAFDVYEDFYKYKNGIYEYTGGKFLGGHAVRIVGYGEEGGVKFWKVANSWDYFWGEEGYFRIRRNTDEVGFESDITAITADVDRSLKDKK